MKNAVRQLLKSPGYTILAIITLAIGIGLNTSMFSLVNLLLLQPLPYPERDRLVRIYRTTPQTQTANHAAADYLELKRQVRDVEHLAAYRMWSLSLAHAGRPAVHLNAVAVTAGFFEAIGMRPALGRFFHPEEDMPGTHVIVLSYNAWHAHFGGDPAIVGRTVRIDGEPTTVIGITPENFHSLFLWGPGDAFKPMALTDAQRADPLDMSYAVLARVKAGTTLQQLNAQLATLARQLAPTRSRGNSADGLQAVTLQSTTRAPAANMSWLLVALAGFVLLIACANLANLQLARTIARTQEFAIRAALGASKARMLQPVVIESLLLSVSGGALGILLAVWSNDWIASRIAASMPLQLDLSIDWRVLMFAVTVSIVTGVAFGLVPAVVLSHIRVNDALKSGTRGNTGGRTQNRLRHALIVGQFALALILLAGASLSIRGFERMLQRDTGWDRRGLVQAVLNLPGSRYKTQEQVYDFYIRLQERLNALPGVENSCVGWSLPTFMYLTSRSYVVDGQPAPAPGREPMASVNGVTPSYLSTLKVRLVAGRSFTDADTLKSTPVVIINDTMARTLFPNENPIGRRIGNPDPDNRTWAEIVGVMSDSQFAMLGAGQVRPFVVYKPLAQEPWNYVTVAVRAANPSAMVDSMRRVIAELDSDLPVQNLSTVEQYVRSNSAIAYLMNTLLATFAGLGVLLAALGLYGVISRLVAQRSAEIGVRVALGAQSHDVVWLILRTALRLTVIGTVLGLIGSYGMGRLFLAVSADTEAAAGDPLAVLAVSLLLIVIALVASWIPARRASRIDPLVALRAE